MGFDRNEFDAGEVGFRQSVADDLAVLARLFAHDMDRPMMEWLRISRFPNNLAIRFDGGDGVQARHQMALAVAQLPQVGDRSVKSGLTADFARLFTERGAAALVCENHWRGEEASVQVASTYARFGFAVCDRLNRPHDFLSFELGFLAHLLDDATLTDGQSCAASIEFLQSHLLQWVPRCLADIQPLAHTAFYQSLNDLLLQYLPNLLRALKQAESDILSVRA